METFGQIPSSRRRTTDRVYSDTKSNEAPEPESASELVALQLEIKSQRERLSNWGKEWDEDRVAADRDIQQHIARTGLIEAVTDVLQNIRDILNEVDRIHGKNVLQLVGIPALESEKSGRIWSQSGGDRRWSTADRARYEQLADELKTSIDLLYEISDSGKGLRDDSPPSSGKSKSNSPTYSGQTSLPTMGSKTFFTARDYNTSQETLVNPTRSSTGKTSSSLEPPPRIDPANVEFPDEEPPPYDSVGATPSIRMIAHLRHPATSSPSITGESHSVLLPILIEYAPYDPAYRSTGVSVPTNRLDSFMAFYARCGAVADFSAYGILPCLGYFEDPKEARFGLVFELPYKVLETSKSLGAKFDLRPVSLMKLLQSASKSLNSSNRILPPGPPLEDRFRLALNVLQSFSKLHVEEHLLHCDVNSSNVVVFCKSATGTGGSQKHEYDVRTPYISSFDLFSEYSTKAFSTSPGRNLYRRPDDPRIYQGACEFCESRACTCAKYRFDIYGLGLLLLEIGLWCPLSDLFKPRYTLEDFQRRVQTIWVERLAMKCGNIYMNVVRDCLQSSSSVLSEGDLRVRYEKWLGKMLKCCLLDEEDTSMEVGSSTLTVSQASSTTQTNTSHHPPTSTNRFLSLRPTPTSTSFFSNPFTRFTSSRSSLPFSIKETDDVSEPTSKNVGGTQPRSEADNISISLTAIKYQRAAKVIQRAWRSRTTKKVFQQYKRNITIVQKQWRKRQELCRSDLVDPDSSTARHAEGQIDPPRLPIIKRAETHIHQERLSPKPKLRVHNVKLTSNLLDQWHNVMLPRLERIVERALKDSSETVSIDLMGVGETVLSAKPTVFITCCSTARVREAVNQKFSYDQDKFDIKIRRGRIQRSKATRSKKVAPPHRSMVGNAYPHSEVTPLNPFYQERPLCGASIGAYVGDKHLPPVSYGGVIQVDGEHFGMTVHHLLDSPSDDEDSQYGDDEMVGGAERSSGRRSDGFNSWLAGLAGHPTLQTVPTDSIFPLEISDDDEHWTKAEGNECSDQEDYTTSNEASEDESVGTEETSGTRGDLKGINPEDSCDIYVTQPAIDDVHHDFFPNVEDKDDDHLNSHKFGYVHASSGIRRWNRNGIRHEIDWALLKLDENRLQPYNLVQGGRKHLFDPDHAFRYNPKLLEPVSRGSLYDADDDEYPVQIARSEELKNLRVHCFGRTSGLQGGVISEAMSAVRIYRRSSFSRSWHVIGNFGVGGDSGAWVIDNEQGRVCGHVLAWCERSAIAYICPMDVLLEDIKKTLGAQCISLPGGEEEEEDVKLGFPPLLSTTQILDGKSAHASDLELPDIARLDFGDRERLGLDDGRAGVMRSIPVRLAGSYPRFYSDALTTGQMA